MLHNNLINIKQNSPTTNEGLRINTSINKLSILSIH